MVRKLKFHEKKLLKKVDFLEWKKEQNLHMIQVMRRYYIQKREDYIKYNKVVGNIKSLVSKLKELGESDNYRIKHTALLLDKLYAMALIPSTKSLATIDKITVSSFCRRRIAVILVKLKMAETIKSAIKFIEQGHIRIGPNTISDPAILVTRSYEDFVTWVDNSKIKQAIMKYHDNHDDFETLDI